MSKLNNLFHIKLFCLLMYLISVNRGVCCLAINGNSGHLIRSIRNTDYFDITGSNSDKTWKWTAHRECPNGTSTMIRHINVGIEQAMVTHYVQHDVLQFDVNCVNGKSTKYTIEFVAPTPPDNCSVHRRFGHYEVYSNIYKEARVEFNITELIELTETDRNYSIATYNSQVYARLMFVRIIDRMCAKLGFRDTESNNNNNKSPEVDSYVGDSSIKTESKNYCPNNLYSYHLDESLLFSKYCLIFLLLFIGFAILCINCYLSLRNKTDDYYIPVSNEITAQNPSPKPPSPIITTAPELTKSPKKFRNGYRKLESRDIQDNHIGNDEDLIADKVNSTQSAPLQKRNGFLKSSYNTFEIQKI